MVLLKGLVNVLFNTAKQSNLAVTVNLQCQPISKPSCVAGAKRRWETPNWDKILEINDKASISL